MVYDIYIYISERDFFLPHQFESGRGGHVVVGHLDGWDDLDQGSRMWTQGRGRDPRTNFVRHIVGGYQRGGKIQ